MSDPLYIKGLGIIGIKDGIDLGLDPDGIYSYDITANEWNKSYSDEVMYDGDYNKMVYHGAAKKIIVLNDQNLITIDLATAEQKQFEHSSINTESEPNIIYFNGAIHIIFTSTDNTHRIISNDDFTTTTVVDDSGIFEDCNHGLMGHKLISINSNLLLIGGCRAWPDGAGGIDPVWSSSMYQYNVANGWILYNAKLPEPLSDFGCIMTANSQYLIIFGGQNDNGHSDRIWVLDLIMNVFVAARISCPEAAKYKACNRNDPEKDELVIVHLFSYGSGKHWTVNLDSLFSRQQIKEIRVSEDVIAAKEKKNKFLGFWLSRKDKKVQRGRYIDDTDASASDYVEEVDEFCGCSICDRLFYTFGTAKKHVIKKHFNRTKSNKNFAINGKHYIFASSRSAMRHGRDYHPEYHSDLL